MTKKIKKLLDIREISVELRWNPETVCNNDFVRGTWLLWMEYREVDKKEFYRFSITIKRSATNSICWVIPADDKDDNWSLKTMERITAIMRKKCDTIVEEMSNMSKALLLIRGKEFYQI